MGRERVVEHLPVARLKNIEGEKGLGKKGRAGQNHHGSFGDTRPAWVYNQVREGARSVHLPILLLLGKMGKTDRRLPNDRERPHLY